MANQTHSTITDPDIHETKGMSTAAKGTVKMALGSGSSAFNKPLALIASGEESFTSSVGSIDFTGLEDYRTIFIVLENYLGQSAQSLVAQVSSDNGSSFETTGYKSAWIDTDTDILNPQTAGMFVLLTSGTPDDGFGFATISNFNDASQYTSTQSNFVYMNGNLIDSATLPTNLEAGSAFSYYPTAEAHNALRLTGLNSQSSSRITYTIWGIRG